MAIYKFDNLPDRNYMASLFGVDPNTIGLTQNADGTWTVRIANDALPDTPTDAELTLLQQATGGGLDVIAG